MKGLVSLKTTSLEGTDNEMDIEVEERARLRRIMEPTSRVSRHSTLHGTNIGEQRARRWGIGDAHPESKFLSPIRTLPAQVAPMQRPAPRLGHGMALTRRLAVEARVAGSGQQKLG